MKWEYFILLFNPQPALHQFGILALKMPNEGKD